MKNARNGFTIANLAALPPAENEAVKTFLREYNRAANPELWAKFDASLADPQNLHVAGYTADGELVGGLLATTSLSWLKIDIMAVAESYRGRGLGSQLLLSAEQEAIRRVASTASSTPWSTKPPIFIARAVTLKLAPLQIGIRTGIRSSTLGKRLSRSFRNLRRWCLRASIFVSIAARR